MKSFEIRSKSCVYNRLQLFTTIYKCFGICFFRFVCIFTLKNELFTTIYNPKRLQLFTTIYKWFSRISKDLEGVQRISKDFEGVRRIYNNLQQFTTIYNNLQHFSKVQPSVLRPLSVYYCILPIAYCLLPIIAYYCLYSHCVSTVHQPGLLVADKQMRLKCRTMWPCGHVAHVAMCGSCGSKWHPMCGVSSPIVW